MGQLSISIMRTLFLVALLPLAFAGPVAQDRWGFGLLEALLGGDSSKTTTTTPAETTATAGAAGETTTKSGIFGLGLLPNNGGLLGFGLFGENSESTTTEADTTTTTTTTTATTTTTTTTTT